MSRSMSDISLLIVAACILAGAFIVSGYSSAAFFTYFGAEDSIVENLTAIGLACAGLLLIMRIVQGRAHVSTTALILGLLYRLAYIWAAGEEISWGQRIFDFESPEYFQQNNDQGEFTFHNLVVGGIKFDESLFGPFLSVIILSYLIVLPALWSRLPFIRAITSAMAIPVPRPHHALVALLVTLIIPLLGEPRRWEVYESIFALLSMAIFINPANPLTSRAAAQVEHPARSPESGS